MGEKIRKATKYIGVIIAGLLQGTLGNYFAILGWLFAFPETEPGMKDYEEDIFFVPFGYIMMLIWMTVMIFAIVKLRKSKMYLVSFLIAWFIGSIGLFVFFFIH